jgi:hypothetical protein
MARNKNLSLSEENFEYLSYENNASELVNSLLTDYFLKTKNNGNKKLGILTMEDIRTEKEKLKNGKSDYEQAVGMLDEQEQTFLRNEEEKKRKAKEKELFALQTFKEYLQHLFIVNEEEAQHFAEEYYKVREKELLYEFGLSVGLVEKPSPTP